MVFRGGWGGAPVPPTRLAASARKRPTAPIRPSHPPFRQEQTIIPHYILTVRWHPAAVLQDRTNTLRLDMRLSMERLSGPCEKPARRTDAAGNRTRLSTTHTPLSNSNSLLQLQLTSPTPTHSSNSNSLLQLQLTPPTPTHFSNSINTLHSCHRYGIIHALLHGDIR